MPPRAAITFPGEVQKTDTRELRFHALLSKEASEVELQTVFP